jgi:hypothetical protein
MKTAGAQERTATRVARSRPDPFIGRFSFITFESASYTGSGGVNSSKEWGCALLCKAAMVRLPTALAAILVRGGRTCNIIRVHLHGASCPGASGPLISWGCDAAPPGGEHCGFCLRRRRFRPLRQIGRGPGHPARPPKAAADHARFSGGSLPSAPAAQTGHAPGSLSPRIPESPMKPHILGSADPARRSAARVNSGGNGARKARTSPPRQSI